MKKYKNFYFENFKFDIETLTWCFYYNFDNEVFFEEKICFKDLNFKLKDDLNLDIVYNILFHIHIALWISYYKFYLSENLVLKSWCLDEKQIEFWKKFYLNWLGEFFYKNKIYPENLLNFINQTDKKYEKIEFEASEKYLVPVGWWKDSIVSIELLKKIWKDIDLVTFAVNDNILYENTANVSGFKRLFLKRYLNNYKELIDAWAYNWHVPITWIIAFVLELACYLYDYRYIVLSNEKSANFWNTIWNWININHQYSKSLEFEKDFASYVSENISNEVKYFSFLRPFYEIKIAEMFSKVWKKYFKHFSSCNLNFKIFKDKKEKKEWYWCNSCPKCVFVYTILRPFLTKDEALKIFSKELFEDEKLEQLFRELAWISGIKPFECVWTNEEVVVAMKIALEKWEWKLPYILEIFQKEIDSKMTRENYLELEKKVFESDYEDTLIPEYLQLKMKEYETI